MGGHHTYEESKKMVWKGCALLAVVTLVEVAVSLFGKGHIVGGVESWGFWFALIIGILLTVLSLYKAYFIVYEFMHMRYEVKQLALTVLLPCLLLVWAIIAFFQEGNSWKERRGQVQEFDQRPIESDGSTSQIYELKEEDIL